MALVLACGGGPFYAEALRAKEALDAPPTPAPAHAAPGGAQ